MHTVASVVDRSQQSVQTRVVPTLRTTRDLLGRRRWREAVRRVVRVCALLVGDTCGAAVSVAAVWSASPVLAPVDGIRLFPLTLLFVVFGQAAQGNYGRGDARRSYGRVAKGVLWAVAALFVVGEVYPAFALGPASYLILGVMAVVTFCTSRLVLDASVSRAQRRGFGSQRTLIVGSGENARNIREHFRRADDPRIRVLGYVAPNAGDEPGALGGLHQVGEIIERHDVRTVVVSAHLPVDSFRDLVQECFLHGTAVCVVPNTINELRCRVSATSILGWPLLELEVPQFHLVQVVLKRAVDLIGALAGLILLAPVFAVIAVAIKLESPGPVLFRQRRPGLGGALFPMFKFRTMRVDAEEVLRRDPFLHKKYLANDCKLPEGEDPRIFRVGRFLRKTSLDELPQLLNILRGEMSLVGPRPVVGPELEYYGVNAPTFLAVKPGMTGYWQISGRSEVAYPHRAELDLHYINRWSLSFDLWILAATIPYVLKRRGAH